MSDANDTRQPDHYEVEHLRELQTWPDPTGHPVSVAAWVHVADIEGEYPRTAFTQWANAQDDPQPGRYRVIERKSYGHTMREFEVELVQEVHVTDAKDRVEAIA